MRNIYALFLIIFSINAFAQSYSGPESVEYDAANNRYLVANKNNGQVIARSPSGTLSVFASGMTSGPYGIEILGNTLYCCYGGGKVRGFDLTTGAQVADVNLDGTFLNGITSDGVKNLYITDFSAKKIYRLNTLTLSFNVFVTGLLKSPNGIIYDGANNRCVFVNWGTSAPIMSLSLSDSTTSTVVNTGFGNMDGIAKDNAGNFYVSCWSNQSVQKYDPAFGTPVSVMTGLSSPADIYYNTLTDTLAIPNSGTANNVVFKFMGTPTDIDRSTVTAPKVHLENERLHLTGSSGSFKVRIYDVTGKEALCSEGEKSIDVSHLVQGIYIWNIEGQKSSAGKFVITR